MEKQTSGPETRKINSIREALAILNAAAEEGAGDVQEMMKADIQSLEKLVAKLNPEVRQALNKVRAAASDSLVNAKDRVVKNAKAVDGSVHNNAWTYLAGVALATGIAGFIFGRSFNSQCQRED